MKKTLLLLLITIGMPLLSQLKPDVVILKNGSEIYGTLVFSDSTKVKIRSNGNIWCFDASEVKGFQVNNGVSHYMPEKKYMINMETGFNGNDELTVEAHLGVLNKLNEKFMVGGGVGLTAINIALLPVYGDFRYSIWNKAPLFKLMAQTGPMFALESFSSFDHRFSWFVETGPALMIDRPKNKAITLSAGWRFTYLNYYRHDWRTGNDIKTEAYLKRFYVKLGIVLF